MPALSRPRPLAPHHTAVVISLVELNRARSHRTLDRGDAGPAEAHPWAYAFPRSATAAPRR